MELLHRAAAGAYEEEGEDGMDEDGKAAADHAQSERRGIREMRRIAFADLMGVLGEGIAGHGLFPD